MKRKKIINLILSLAVITSIFTPFSRVRCVNAESQNVDIMFIGDTHSHLEAFNTMFEGKYENMGGFARLKTLINTQKEKNPDTLLLDAGDFSMGTMFHTLFETEAAELLMIGDLGVEVTTIGNHEFDFDSEGLSNMIDVAIDSGEYIPPMVLCNVDWDACKDNAGAGKIKVAFEKYNVKPYTVIEKNGVKMAVIGVFGIDALDCAPTCELAFIDPVKAVKETVSDIKNNEDVDMIILLSHSGLGSDATTDIDGTNLVTSGESEDEVMAKSVPELDLIISGHSHTTVKKPLIYGDTYIVGCGEYTEQIGNLSMTRKEDGRWEMPYYELLATRDDVEEDLATKEKVDDFADGIDKQYLEQFGYTRKQVLAKNENVFDTWSDTYDIHTESNLGDILSDSFRVSASKALGEEVDFAVVPSGCIRDTIPLGDVTVNDVFSAYSLGIGPDGVCGYPLVKLYLSGKDVKLVTEVDATLSDLMHSARLYVSGLGFTYNPNRIPLNKVTDIWVIRDGNREEIIDDKKYSLVVDLYTLRMISSVENLSKGLLKINLTDENGNLVKDYENYIIHESDGTELKAWEAVAHYIDDFDDDKVPDRYSGWDGRKNVDESISSMFGKMNKYAVIIVSVVVIIFVLIALIIYQIIKGVRKRITSNRG